jgi:hypothetical protein
MWHVWRRGEERRGAYWVLVTKREGKKLLGRLGVDGRIILKLILKKYDGEARTGLVCHGAGRVGGLF